MKSLTQPGFWGANLFGKPIKNDFFEYYRTRILDEMLSWWDDPTMIVTLDAKRRLTIPVDLAPAAPGDRFEAVFDPDEDVVSFRRIKRKPNWLAVWKTCPVPMNDLPGRIRELPKKRRL
jgi:hypothetical protein